MKVAAVGVGLSAYLRPAGTARVVVLVAARQDEQELLPDGRHPLAAGAEEARRLQLAKAVYHALILDQGGVGSAWSALSSQMGAHRVRHRPSPGDHADLLLHRGP